MDIVLSILFTACVIVTPIYIAVIYKIIKLKKEIRKDR